MYVFLFVFVLSFFSSLLVLSFLYPSILPVFFVVVDFVCLLWRMYVCMYIYTWYVYYVYVYKVCADII